MLILTRRKGESLRLGDDILITVLENGPNQVRLGISAPRSLMVLREELFEGLQAGNRLAASQTQPLEQELAEIKRGLGAKGP